MSRRVQTVSVLVAVLGLVVLGTDVYLLSQRNVTHRVSLQTAIQRFRASRVSDPRVVALAARPVNVTSTTRPSPTAATSVAARRVPSTTSSTSAAPRSVTTPSGPTMPAEGVYSYRTTGGEQINILNSGHSYPAVTYATVRHDGACWQIENDVIQEHTDKRDFCGFAEQDQSRTITFFGATDGLKYTCVPRFVLAVPGESVGTAHNGVCADSAGDGAHLRAVDQGLEHITVGGVPVTVVHVVVDAVLTGRAVGTSHDDLLLVATTGMTVSWHRTVDTIADAAFGAKAHYTENATFDLIAMTPQI